MTSWEGFDLTPAHGRWRFWLAQGRDELPGARTSADLIPFRRGRLHQPATADVRRLELRGYIAETDLAGLLATRDEIKRLLDPEALAPGLLVDEFEDGSTRWIRAVPRTADATYAGEGKRLYSIELEALDPFWYGAWGILALDAGYLLDVGEVLDSGAELVIAGVGDATIATLGSAEIERVRVRIVGPSAGSVGIETVGAEPVGFTIARTLAAGETIEVDNFARTALLGGVSLRNLMTLSPGNRHGEYIRLPAGDVTLRATGGAAETRILFNPTYE